MMEVVKTLWQRYTKQRGKSWVNRRVQGMGGTLSDMEGGRINGATTYKSPDPVKPQIISRFLKSICKLPKK